MGGRGNGPMDGRGMGGGGMGGNMGGMGNGNGPMGGMGGNRGFDDVSILIRIYMYTTMCILLCVFSQCVQFSVGRSRWATDLFISPK